MSRTFYINTYTYSNCTTDPVVLQADSRRSAWSEYTNTLETGNPKIYISDYSTNSISSKNAGHYLLYPNDNAPIFDKDLDGNPQPLSPLYYSIAPYAEYGSNSFFFYVDTILTSTLFNQAFLNAIVNAQRQTAYSSPPLPEYLYNTIWVGNFQYRLRHKTGDWNSSGWNPTDITLFKNNLINSYNLNLPASWTSINLIIYRGLFSTYTLPNFASDFYIVPLAYEGNNPNCDEIITI